MTKQAIIIFTKNPVYGKVKTRLAAVIGNNEALKIYQQLIQHTYLITHQLKADKIVFYSDIIIENDIWKDEHQKQLQIGNDLGERMLNAFNYVFKLDYNNAIIIGTDCPELDEKIIIQAFKSLKQYDVVIGPSADGGYYLLGMQTLNVFLFEKMEWSTNTVLNTTIERCNTNHLSYLLLNELHDVDEAKDLQYMKAIER